LYISLLDVFKRYMINVRLQQGITKCSTFAWSPAGQWTPYYIYIVARL